MSPSLVTEEEVQSVPGHLEDEGSDKVLAREGEDKHNLGMGTPQVLQGLGTQQSISLTMTRLEKVAARANGLDDL